MVRLTTRKSLDSFGTLHFYGSHGEGRMKEKFPFVKPEDAEEAMLAVTKEGRVFKGFYAFHRLVWKTPWLWPDCETIFFLVDRLALGDVMMTVLKKTAEV